MRGSTCQHLALAHIHQKKVNASTSALLTHAITQAATFIPTTPTSPAGPLPPHHSTVTMTTTTTTGTAAATVATNKESLCCLPGHIVSRTLYTCSRRPSQDKRSSVRSMGTWEGGWREGRGHTGMLGGLQ